MASIRIVRVLIAGAAGPPGPPGTGGMLPNLAALKAADLPIGFARTEGYFSAGDDGGGYWQIVAGGGAPANDAFLVDLANGRRAKLVLPDPTTMHVRQLGCVADGVTDDAARITLGETSTVSFFDLGGRTVFTTLPAHQHSNALTKYYFNGTIIGSAYLPPNAPVIAHGKFSLPDTALQRPRTKSPVLDWDGLTVLWLGTSIPQQGAGDNTSYANFGLESWDTTIINNAWAGSGACYNPAFDPTDIAAIKCLSMTQDDVAWGLSQPAPYGPGSAYDDAFDPVTKASKMTADWQIKKVFQNNPVAVVVLDHNHNDRDRPPGTLTPEGHAITAITRGANTLLTINAIGSLVVGDAVAIRVTGIDSLDYAAARVQAIAGNVVTLHIDSTAYAGTFASGTLYKVDRNSIYGAWWFLIYYTLNCSKVFGDGNVKIILAGAPNEWTTGVYEQEVYSVGCYIKDVADFFDLSYFDITYEFDIKEHDLLTYFPDTFHPLTIPQRQALGNYWGRWFGGGATKVRSPKEFLPAGIDRDYSEQAYAVYSRFLGGFGTPNWVSGPASLVFSDNFSGGLVNWTVGSGTPTVITAPWSASEKAVDFLCTPALASRIDHNIVLGRGRIFAFDFWLPEVSGLTAGSSTTVALCNLRSSGSYYSLQAVVKPTTVGLRVAYFQAPNVNLVNLDTPNVTLVKQTKYRVQVEAYQGVSPTDQGKLLFSLDGAALHAPYELDDSAQTPIASFRLGAFTSNTGQNFEVIIGNVALSQFNMQGLTARFSGTVTVAGGTLTFVNGLATTLV
jgi:hypothetical protein